MNDNRDYKIKKKIDKTNEYYKKAMINKQLRKEELKKKKEMKGKVFSL